jgi:ribose 1,5-bisphosphokinase
VPPDNPSCGPVAPGTLVLVVGPSGAGKDSLIDAARRNFERDSRISFPRRWVTRGEEAGGERHIAVSEEGFEQLRKRGAFALSWRAHGLGYGVPAEIAADLEAGRAVVANVSRGVIEEARWRFPDLRICHVTASPEALAQRLATRGRETAAEVATRLARAPALPVEGDDVVEIRNDGSLDQATERFMDLLRRTLR